LAAARTNAVFAQSADRAFPAPKMDIFTSDVQPWDLLDPDATHFDYYPS
jgi:hypothetical protein